MKSNKTQSTSTNPFSLTFGVKPNSFIDNNKEIKQVTDDFNSDFPLSFTYFITGLRGTGKTVLLTSISKKLSQNDDWIVADINPERPVLEQIAGEIMSHNFVKRGFLKKELSFSFHGIGLSIEGDNPVPNVVSLVKNMLEILKKHEKKLLICIDEVSNTENIRTFAHDYQIFLRNNYKVYLLMTGLNQNVTSLQNHKNLTFLLRTPKISLSNLDLKLVQNSFEKIFNLSSNESKNIASICYGYPFAYQLAGFLYWKYRKIDSNFIKEFDSYLAKFVYNKIWEDIPLEEKKFLELFNSKETKWQDIINKNKRNEKSFSVYRRRLIDKGIIISPERGKIAFTLPRFKEYIISLNDNNV